MDEPRFTLGEMVVHACKGYRGVVAGWDLACCESAEWQEAAGVRCGGPLWARRARRAAWAALPRAAAPLPPAPCTPLRSSPLQKTAPPPPPPPPPRSQLAAGADQVFYHILVDARDWPPDAEAPPVAYVAEELLTGGSGADFSSDHPLIVSAPVVLC